MPPSTAISAPVMNADSGDARKSAAYATSSAVPKRLSGVCSSRASEKAFTRRTRSVSAVSIKPGRQRVDPDVVGPEFDRKPARQSRYRALGGAIGRERAHAAVAHDRGEIDERRAARRLHQRKRIACNAHDAVKVHLAQPDPVGVRHVAKVSADVDAGIVDDGVEPAMLLLDRGASAPIHPARAKHRPSWRSLCGRRRRRRLQLLPRLRHRHR